MDDSTLSLNSLSPLEKSVESDTEDSRIPSSIYELFETSTDERREFNKENTKPSMENEKQEQKPPPDFVLGFRFAGSGRGLGGASRPGGIPKNIFGNDSDDENDHMEFFKNRVKKGHGSIMPGRNTFKPPKIGEPKPIEQIRREHALKNESEIPKQQVKRLADTQWDDDIDYDPIVSPQKKQKIADNDTGYELDFATSPKNTKFVEKSYINIQKTNLTDKYAISSNKSSKLCRTPEQSPDTSFDEEEEFGPPSPIITSRYAAREKMSGTKFGGFSSGIGTQVTIDTSVINAAREKLDDTGFASGLGSQMNADYSSAKFGGNSGGFGTKIKIVQGEISAAKNKLLNEPAPPINGFSTAAGKDVSLNSSSGFSTGFGKAVKIDESAVYAAKDNMYNAQVDSSFVSAKPRPNFQNQPKVHEKGETSVFDQLTESQKRITKVDPHASRACFSHNRQESSMLLSLRNNLLFEVDDLQATKFTAPPKQKICSTPKNIDPIKTLGPLELSPIRESTVFTPGEIKIIIEHMTKSKEYIEQRKKAVPDKKPRPGCLYRQKKDKNRKSMKLSDMKISPSKGGKEDVLILTYYSKKEVLQKQIKCLDSGNLHCDENGEIRIEHFQIALQTSTISPQFIGYVTLKWVENHVQLIRRKLIAYDRLYGIHHCYHTPVNIMRELRLRFDREMIDGARSHFKKLSANDINPELPFVAFLSSPNTISDGWYEAEINTDSILAKRLSKLKFGTKILVTNAKFQPGHKEAESPIESPLKLVLHANGVTAIKSSKTVKLGEFRDFPIFPLKTLVPYGGMATRIKVLILREYPSLYIVENKNAEYGPKRRAIAKRQFEAEQQKRIREYRRETGETGFSKTAYRVFRASCAFDESNNEHSCMLRLKASKELKIERGMVFEILRPRIAKYSNNMEISELEVTTMEEIKSDQTFAALHRQMIPCKMEEIQCKNPLFPGELDLVGVIIECTPKAIYLSNMRQNYVKVESDTAWADVMLHKKLKVGEVVAFQSLKLYGIRLKFEQRTSDVFVCQSKPPTMSNILYKLYIAALDEIITAFQSKSNDEKNQSLNIRSPIEKMTNAARHNTTLPATVQSRVDALDRSATYWGNRQSKWKSNL